MVVQIPRRPSQLFAWAPLLRLMRLGIPELAAVPLIEQLLLEEGEGAPWHVPRYGVDDGVAICMYIYIYMFIYLLI